MANGAIRFDNNVPKLVTPTGANLRLGPSVAINVREHPYNAVGDGVADDGPAIRAAIAAAATGDTSSVFLPRGTYLIGSLALHGASASYQNCDWVFAVTSSNLTIEGEGVDATVIKMANGIANSTPAGAQNGGAGIYFLNASHVAIRNLTLDMNGLNNLVPAATTRFGYGVMFKNCNYSYAENVKVKDCYGTNSFVALGHGVSVDFRHCWAHNGGTSLAGNTNQTDFSAFYADHTVSHLSGIKVTHDSFPFGNCGGVEMHDSGQVLEHSYIEKSYPAVYVVSETGAATTYGQRVLHNDFIDCLAGVSLTGTGDFDGLQIVGNRFQLKYFALPGGDNPSIAYGIATLHDDTGDFSSYTQILKNSAISGNSFTENGAMTTVIRTVGMRLGMSAGLHVHHNTFQGLSGYAVTIRGNPTSCQDVQINHNLAVDCGNNTGPEAFKHYAYGFDFSGDSLLHTTGYNATRVWAHHNVAARSTYNGAVGHSPYLLLKGSASTLDITIEDSQHLNMTALRNGGGNVPATTLPILPDDGLKKGIKRTATTTPITVTTLDELILINMATPGPVAVNMHSAPLDGQRVTFKDVRGDAGTNNITITRGGSTTIDSNTTAVVNVNSDFRVMVYDAGTTNWNIVGMK